MKKHIINIRGVLPVWFARFYFVILFGRDTRTVTQELESNRRTSADTNMSVVFLFFMFLPVVILIGLGYYYIKSELGIDLFSDFHLSDVIDYIF